MTARADRPSQVPAAQYLRMSREHQRYSFANQAAAITAFAEAHGYVVVRSYEDAGQSGLGIRRREGLKALLADAISGNAPFRTILVYDVSRWGRFQDTDQSAHYEFLCREAGVSVEYCAEQFANDGSLLATLTKNLKRAMAAEYSRELSVKITAGQARLAALGYWQGGESRYGFRRMLVDEQGAPIRVLAPGERKAIQSQRVVLVAGPPEEVATVRRIFRCYAAGDGPTQIAQRLRDDGVPGWLGMPWSRSIIRRMIQDEKYIGVLVSGKRRAILGGGVRAVPPDQWRRLPGGCPPLVSKATWVAAQAARVRLNRRMGRDSMLDALRRLLREHGRLSTTIIAAAGPPGPRAVRSAFGSAAAAYQALGYEPARVRPVVGRYLARIRALVEANETLPLADRLTVADIYERLRREGYRGSRSSVRIEARRIRLALGRAGLRCHNWMTEEEILDEIGRVYAANGFLDRRMIAAVPHLPSVGVLCRTFGSLAAIYKRVGFVHGPRKWALGRYLTMLDEMIAANHEAPAAARLTIAEMQRRIEDAGYQGSYTTVRKYVVRRLAEEGSDAREATSDSDVTLYETYR